MKQIFLFLCSLFMCAISVFGQTLDQSNAPSDIGGGGFTVSSTGNVGQSFTAGLTGNLSQVNVRLGDFSSFTAGDFQIRIFDGEGYDGSVLNTTVFNVSSVPSFNYAEIVVPLSSTLAIVAGNKYTIDLRGISGAASGHGTGGGGATYTAGLFYANQSSFNSYSLWFKTFVTLPSPATHLNFDGVNDYVTIANESNFDFTNQMTVEFWMNSNVLPEQWDGLVVKGDDSWRVALTATGTVAFAGTSAFTDFYSTTSVTDGSWHHITVTYDGVNAKIYVDGILESQVAGTANINNSSYSVSIGENLQMTGRYFTGNMDDIRIWNTARTVTQINAAMSCELQGNESGLVAYYQFNQGIDQANNSTITTLFDTTSNANSGALTNFALNGATSNWLAGSPVITGSTIPVAPTANNQTFCTASTVNDLVPAPSATTNWYSSATSSTALNPTDAITTNVYYVANLNAAGCESDRVSVNVTVSNFTVTISNQINVTCFGGNDGSVTLSVSGGVAPYTISWDDGATTFTRNNLIAGTYRAWITDDAGCTDYIVGGGGTLVTITEPADLVAPTVSSPVVYNQGDTATPLTATSSADGLLWYTTATGGTGSTTAPTPSTATVGSTSYWVSSTNSAGCESSTRSEIVVTVNALDATHLNFDGVDDYVVIPNGGGLNNLQTGTIEAWVKWTGNQDQDAITFGQDYYGAIMSRQSNGVFTNQIIGLDNTNPDIAKIVWAPYGIGAPAITSTISPMDDSWVHIAIVYQNGNHNLYVNGVLDGTSTATGSMVDNASIPLTIGGWIGDGNCFSTSSIDEVRIWNVARTETQLNASKDCELQGTETGLVAYYQFNQGVDQADNTSINTLIATTGTDGTLTNFTLNGATSNWLAGSPVTTGSVIPGVPTVITPINYNVGDTATALTATIGANGTGLLWYTTASGGTGSITAPTPSTATAGSTSYWVTSVNANGCESERVEIVVIVNAYTNPPTTNWSTQVFTGDDKDLTVLQVAGSNLLWYDAAIGGNVLPNTTLLIDETTYYVSQTLNGVESTDRLAITVNRISDNTQLLPPGSTVADLVSTPSASTTSQWFANATGGAPLSGTDVLSNGVYYVEQSTNLTTVETVGSGFNMPYGIAVQADGKILVTDIGNNAIKRMNPDGTNIEILTPGVNINSSSGITVQPDGKIVFMGNDAGNRIMRMNSDGSNVETLISGLPFTGGLAIQNDGKILFTTIFNVMRMDSDGSNNQAVGPVFSFSRGVTVQPDGKIVVAETNNFAVKRMNPDGTNVESLNEGNFYPYGIAIQSDGKIVFADDHHKGINRMNSDGSNVEVLTSTNGPRGLAIESNGNILFVDASTNTVNRIILSTPSNRVPVNVDVTTLSTSSFALDNFNIYPNPTSGVFTIKTEEALSVEVYDVTGRLILKDYLQTTKTLSIERQEAGMYLINIKNKFDQLSTFKIIKL